MFKITNYLSLVLLFFIFGCNTAIYKQEMQKKYNKSLKFFPLYVVSHFPKEVSDNSWFQTDVPFNKRLADYCFAHNYLMFEKSYEKSSYLRQKEHYDSLALEMFYTDLASNILIFSYCDSMKVDGEIYRNQESLERKNLAKHNLKEANGLPVPLFKIDRYKGNTYSGLSNDFKIYILDAKQGKFLKDKYLYDCECLPKKWKHGFSKGVALSDKRKVIIYWVTVW